MQGLLTSTFIALTTLAGRTRTTGLLHVHRGLCFKDRVSLCSQAGLELMIPVLQTLECWDYRCETPHQFLFIFKAQKKIVDSTGV
jgi:hypothetical protein